MPLIDVFLFMIIFGFTLFGLWSGFIRSLGSLIGFFLGIYIASKLFVYFDVSLSVRIIIFIATYFIFAQLVGLLFFFLQKIFHIISIIPFTKSINRLLGAILGFIEGLLLVIGAIYILENHTVKQFFDPLANSTIAPLALKIATILEPFLAQTFKTMIQMF